MRGSDVMGYMGRNISASSRSDAHRLARGLGYFSLVLGAAELVGSRGLARQIGLAGRETLLQIFGVREMAAGAAILASHDPTPWMWGRLAGDALDLATLGQSVAGEGRRSRLGPIAAIASVCAVAAVDAACATKLMNEKGSRRTARCSYADRSGFPRGVARARGAAAVRVRTIPRDRALVETAGAASLARSADAASKRPSPAEMN